MSDKISESSWKEFVKKQKLAVALEDKDLLKALARLDNTDEHKPEPRLDALKDLVREIPKQVTALLKLKKPLGDSTFVLLKDRLHDMLAEAEALQTKSETALHAAQDRDAEEDEDSRPDALVDPKLLFRQLSQCRREPERRVQFAYVDARDRHQPAVLAIHPRTSGRALFSKLQAAAGVKTGAFGEAWVEDTVLMLRLEHPLPGLVKKVRAPVKACGFRITKAVLWNADGSVFEQDELPEEAIGDDPSQASAGGPAAPGSPDAGKPQEGTDAAAAFKARLTALIPRIQEAQSAGHPGAPEARLKASEAGVLAAKRDYERAAALLDEAEQLLAQQRAAGAAGDPDHQALLGRMSALTPRVKQAVADNAPFRDVILRTVASFQEHLKAGEAAAAAQSLDALAGLLQDAADARPGAVDYAKARLVWLAARNNARAELQRLEHQIIAEYQDEPSMLPSVTKGVRRLDRILKALDESLADKLDEGLNAADPAQRASINQQSRAIIGQYLDFLETDPLVAAVEDNPFTPVGLEGPLSETLKALAAQLA